VQGKHPQNLGEIGVGYEKVAVHSRKSAISLKRDKTARVTVDCLYKVISKPSIADKIDDLE